MKKTCCILYNEPAINAGPDELDILDQVELVEQQLAILGISSFRKGITLDFFNEIESVGKSTPDFVFNLVESINNKGQLIYFAPAVLNLKELPYTGCPLESIFITSNKQLATRILRMGGVPTPGSYSTMEAGRLHCGRRYIIKPKWEDGSMGITSESVFTFSPEDESRLGNLHPNEWFIEDYIDGREFNISLYSGINGPVVLPPAEIEFRNYTGDKPRIVDFKAKWEANSFEYLNTVRVFPKDIYQTGLFDSLSKICIDSWNILGLKGYARIDIRCDSENNPFVLEVNANPCISPDSGFIAACLEAGNKLSDVFGHIINDLN